MPFATSTAAAAADVARFLRRRRCLFSSYSGVFDEGSVLATLSSYSSDWRRALEFFNWVSTPPHNFPHTTSTLSLAVSILGKHFEFPLAISLIDSHRPLAGHDTFRSLFHRLAAARLSGDAVDAFNRSGDLGLRDETTFSLLIDALCEHRQAPEAAELCLKSPPFALTTQIYNILLRGWAKMGWFGKCRDFWVEMDRLGVRKDLHSYTIFMDFLTKSGKPWKAVKLYKELKKKRKEIPLDVVAYNAAILAVGLAEGVDRAIHLFREMQDLGFRPNAATFNTVVKLLCKEGRVSEGYRFVGQMKKMGLEPDVITYHCFFRNLNRPREILFLFERMVENGCTPRMETYVMLMKKFGRLGFLRPVFHVWRTMKEQGFSPDGFAYNAMIDALVAKGMVEMARRFEEEMLDKDLAAKPRKELLAAREPLTACRDDDEVEDDNGGDDLCSY